MEAMTAERTHSESGPARLARRPALPPDLDAFDRMLMTADGTVTTLLEACTAEPVGTQTLRESGPAMLATLMDLVGPWWDPDAALLDLDPTDEVIARRALLRGSVSRMPYVLAESLVVPRRLPETVTDGLGRPGSSIGRLMASCAIESRRELLQTGLRRAAEASSFLELDAGAQVAWRTYRIVLRGRSAILLTEMTVPGRLQRAASQRPARAAPGTRAYRLTLRSAVG